MRVPPAILRVVAARFIKAREGSAAVEFAFIAAPFFLIIFATLEVALFFLGAAVIENGVAEAARDIRTGRVQTAGQTEADFRAAICQRIDAIADCSRLRVDVRTFENFSDSTFDSPLDADGEIDDTDFRFEPGGAGDVVVVRAFYDWPLFAPGMVSGMSNMANNRRLVSATTAFRNEPFE